MKRSSTHIIHLGNRPFTYTLHRKKGQKHKYIRIKNGDLIVSAPYLTPINSIDTFLSQKSDWILKHTGSNNKRFDLTSEDAHIYLLGEKYPVDISRGTRDDLQIKENRALFTLRDKPSHPIMLLLLQKFYRREAPNQILPRVEQWSRITGLKPARISFRKAKTRWGSCSSTNNISLNIYLAMLHLHLIDYIVVHELIHIKFKNHSRKFWSGVESYIPQWREAHKELRKYEKYMV